MSGDRLAADETDHSEWEKFSPTDAVKRRGFFGVPEYIAAVVGVLSVAGLVARWPAPAHSDRPELVG